MTVFLIIECSSEIVCALNSLYMGQGMMVSLNNFLIISWKKCDIIHKSEHCGAGPRNEVGRGGGHTSPGGGD